MAELQKPISDREEALSSAITDSKGSFQSIIDAAEAERPELYQELQSNKEQIRALNLRNIELEALIKEAEGPEVEKARATQKVLEMIESGGDAFPLMRGFGMRG